MKVYIPEFCLENDSGRNLYDYRRGPECETLEEAKAWLRQTERDERPAGQRSKPCLVDRLDVFTMTDETTHWQWGSGAFYCLVKVTLAP